MDKEGVNTSLSVGLGLLSILAIIGLVVEGNFGISEVYGAVINFTQVAIPVLVLLVANALRKSTVSYQQVGREALAQLQKDFSSILMGPRYNRDGYDPEKGKGLEYLFVTNDDPKSQQRAKFIPVQPLDEGVLAIYVQKGTLVYGLGYPSESANPEEILKVQNQVSTSVKQVLASRYAGQFEIVKESKDDTAIMVDFNEQIMGPRKFKKAISEAARAATEALVSCRCQKV